MKYLVLVLLAVMPLVGCVTKDQVADTLKNNPEILAEAIKKNPAVFMDAVRDAAQNEQRSQMIKAQEERQQQIEKDLKNPRKVKVDESRIVFGDVKAPITIVKYADFQCPACRMGYFSLEEVKKKYPGKIRVIHKNIPLEFHKQARPAALVYEALIMTNKAKALEFYKAAYEQQESWAGSNDKLWALVKKLGIKKDIVMAQGLQGTVTERINEDLKEWESNGFEGTPAYIVGGVALYGAPSPEDLGQLIERLLKK